MTNHADHPHDDLSKFPDDPAPDLEGHLNAVHCHRLVSLMGMKFEEQEALHASDHLLAVLNLEKSPTSALHALMNSLNPVVEMVTGYKKVCREAGFGEEAAELMAGHLHEALIRQISGPSNVKS